MFKKYFPTFSVIGKMIRDMYIALVNDSPYGSRADISFGFVAFLSLATLGVFAICQWAMSTEVDCAAAINAGHITELTEFRRIKNLPERTRDYELYKWIATRAGK